MSKESYPIPPNRKNDDRKTDGRRRVNGRVPTGEYFRRLRRRLKIGLSVAFIVPILILSAYFHFQFNTTLKESGKLHLRLLAESQRNTVDLFLQERVVNILNLFHVHEFHVPPTPDEMRLHLQHLREMSDAFIDVSFLNSKGVQNGYAGPYPFLKGKDYSNEDWFKTLMSREQNYYITGIYMGFRNCFSEISGREKARNLTWSTGRVNIR